MTTRGASKNRLINMSVDFSESGLHPDASMVTIEAERTIEGVQIVNPNDRYR